MTLTACAKREPAGAAALASQMETMEWRAPDCEPADDCTSVTVDREVFSDRPALNEAVRLQLLEQLQGNGETTVAADTSLAQVAQAFIEDAGKVADISSARWQMTGDAKALARRGNLLTVQITSYVYSGGAHGMPVTRWLNWDLSENRRVVLEDVIKSGAEGKFWSLAQAAHQQWLETQNAQQDFRENWPFARSEDFRFTDKGLVLRYGVYTLGPYSMGEVELLIPREQLVEVVREDF
ncbi:DUF3298 and DUF4163 domain-containing protein [Microbulbifer pacificus]|uniref:DUF3298 domain-containing protein n=1 Tax=Microbulbifer pacificus TaxID=407164 RepID=A0AAU0N4R6_9GAMM|nr:DUF3298 domain-containing protein [Microbulbifer pacificus]WOX07036.1 DUF3298 domain-containing protein [Microbulbifer pacificus]